jgi:hypothetical protein
LYDAKIGSKVQQGVVLDEEVEEKVVKEVDGQNDSPLKKSSCSCSAAICTCCQRISVPKLGINSNYCLSLKYSGKTNSMWVTLWIDGQVAINTDVTVSNPRTICVPIRCRMPGIKICLQFQGVKVVSGWATGCSKILVYCPGGLVAVVSLGCFRMHCIDATRQMVEGSQVPEVVDTEQVNLNEIPMEILSPAGYKNGRM